MVEVSPTSATSLLRLLDLARLAHNPDLDAVLTAVAETVRDVLGYRSVVVNLHRPEWDDLEVVHVTAEDPDVAEALLGTRAPWDSWERLLQPAYLRRGAHVIQHGDVDWGSIVGFVPDVPAPDDPRAWHPEDAVFVALRGDDGELFGVLSVDEPANGLRPSDEELDLLVAVASHAALALSHAKTTMEAARLRAARDDLLRLSRRVGEGRLDAALQDVCEAIRRGLGFERVAVLLCGPDGDALAVRASVGFDEPTRDQMSALSLGKLAPLFAELFERHGCQLLEDDEARALVPADQVIYTSQRNGRGVRAWEGHWLLVPLHDASGRLVGVVWPDDPKDLLLPGPDSLRALRLFSDHAATVLHAAGQVAHLRHLAEHDPLTGVRNRRGLPERLAELVEDGRGPLSVLFADLDRFKWVNDELGHEVGDEVLRTFGGLLRRQEHRHAGAVAVRLGGEEFCLVLPRCDAARALHAAEELRAAAAARLGEQVPGLTVSVGVATSGRALPGAADLLRAADQALYAAKRLGRDRVVAFDPALADGGDRRDGGRADASLSAVLVLAATIDLRDPSTSQHSRTVARLAELAGRELGLGGDRLEQLRIAGVLHDVGKVAVPDAILFKDGPLDDEEWAQIRRHPEVGAQIVAHAGLGEVARWVLSHHERLDGRGYPAGLAGEEIPLEGRILAVADAYEAMVADRPYRAGMPPAAARAELRRCEGSQFDPAVVDALLRALDREEAGTGAPAVAAA